MKVISVLLAPFRLLLALLSTLLLILCWFLSIVFVWPIGVLSQKICCCQPKVQPSPIDSPTFSVSDLRDVEQPKFHVAIIGTGWTGLGAAKVLQQRGVKVTMFEALDDLGGTWHSKVTYSGLSIHTPLEFCQLDGFPHPEIETRRYERIKAPEVQEYLRQFAKHFHITPTIQFNSKVTGINHDTTTGLASVTVANTMTGDTSHHNNFHIVLNTAFSTKPYMPTFPGHEQFEGELLHASELDEAKLEELLTSTKKIVVLGGGKSAIDIMLMFLKDSYRHITWVYRKSYYFFRFDRVSTHRKTRSVIGRIRGFFLLWAMSLSVLSNTLACFCMWFVGGIATAFGTHFDLKHFHLGSVKDEEFALLRKAAHQQGHIKTLTPNGIQFKGCCSKPVECDVLICATGYRTGLNQLELTIDDVPLKIDLNAPLPLYQHIFLPQMPTVAFSVGGFYSIGPSRGTPIAEHVWRFLHERSTAPETMEKSAARNIAHLDLASPALFNSKVSVVQIFMFWSWDMVRTGIFSPAELFRNNWEMYVNGRSVIPHVRKQPSPLLRNASSS